MTSPQLTAKLPTLDLLNVKQEEIDSIKSDQASVNKIVEEWLTNFLNAIEAKDGAAVVSLLLPDAFWRDLLALTWNIRSFYGKEDIKRFVDDRAFSNGWEDLKVDYGKGMTPILQQMFPDLAWIQFFITFKVNAGSGQGVVKLVPTRPPNEPGKLSWKAYSVFTALMAIDGHPELIGPLRNHNPNHGFWPSDREKEINYLDREPAVLIIGAGQSGINVAARLKVLGVDAVIIEKKKEVGQQWRDRYEALCLHDPVWYDHLPYIPFPKNWPTFSPAPKISSWLKSYAEAMELNVWTSSNITSMDYDEKTKTWEIKVERGGGEGGAYGKRTLKPRRVVFAIGLASGVPNMPNFKGQDVFKGRIIHSSEHGTARNYIGKKALVIGACTSAHDICYDFYMHGVDVTMYQRSPTYIMSTKNGLAVGFAGTYEEGGPPVEVADLIMESLPRYAAKPLQQRATKIIKELDREILQDLEKVGFMLTDGIDGSGFPLLAWTKAGGYYFDVGTSRLVADEKIKLVSKTNLSHFTEKSAVFEDGREVPCDVVICATGYGDGKGPIKRMIGPRLGASLKPAWGLDEEGEMISLYRGSGVENLWIMVGNLALCRFYSLHLALQIKALEEGVWDGKRYGE